MTQAPRIYVRQGKNVVEKVAPLERHCCWWCSNPLMYKVSLPGIFVDEIFYYQCPECGAKEDMYGLTFTSGVGDKKTTVRRGLK